jgi:hypothetical protein
MTNPQDHPAIDAREAVGPSYDLDLCPWCAGLADFENLENGRYSVGCNDSEGECLGFQLMTTFATKREAQKAWNRRAALSRPASEERELPDIGPDPMKTDGAREGWEERLKQAYVIQQKGVPDQTALVWRFDLGQMRYALIRNRAMAELWQADRKATPTHPSAPDSETGWRVPDGMALVPVEPTEAMLLAAHNDLTVCADMNDEFRATWAAMLSAAPTTEERK